MDPALGLDVVTIEYEETILIQAPPEKVWAVYTDVEKWPEWTPSMKHIERLDEGPLALGKQARVSAEGAPTSVFTVTEHTEGRSFIWSTTTRGIKAEAYHIVEPDGAGTKATLGVRMSGLMATIFAPMIRRTATRNVHTEAEGLKQRCEASGR